MPLTDLKLRPVYNHGNCPDLLAGLYEPLLEQAVRYDRTTYTFTAEGMIAAATGTAGLIRNGGRIRLICDHSVRDDVLRAIHDGQLDAETALQQTVSREDLLLTETADIADRNHLELAYWLVANGIMEMKVAIRGDRIFHNKSGIVEDAQGNRVAFAGSLNETLSGWRHNWESVHVYTDGATIQHLEATEAEFQALWTNRAAGLNVIDLPAYYRDYIVERAPASPPETRSIRERRNSDQANDYWQGIYDALASDPDSTVATIPTTLWPHQELFRQQNVLNEPVRRLIADEVGLGKTLQASVILKTRLNQGKARKALVIAPKAATRQWQGEMLMKFAIDAPIIDTHGRYYRSGRTEPSASPPWDVPLAIAGHQWLVRNADQFLSSCGEYDLIIVDEAHRARFRDVDLEQRRQPNQYLRLLRQLSRRTRELLLLTATPMQLNEVELWALLELMEPNGWNAAEYRRFYQDEPPDLAEWKYRRDLWRKTNPPDTSDFLLDSDNDDYIARQLDDPVALQTTLDTMQQSAPAKRLMSRHTRELLRQYRRQGLLDMPVPERHARDVTITMTPEERRLYDGIKPLVQQCYGGRGITHQALGFITTIFRKRMGSSTYAYAQTLRNVANRIPQNPDDWMTLLNDADWDELTDRETNALNNAANLDTLLNAADEAERLSKQDTKRRQFEWRHYRAAGTGTQPHPDVHAVPRHPDLAVRTSATGRPLRDRVVRAGWSPGRPRPPVGRIQATAAGYSALHGNSVRIAQPAVLLRRSQLRHSLEPDDPRTAGRSHRPHWARTPSRRGGEPVLRRLRRTRRLRSRGPSLREHTSQRRGIPSHHRCWNPAHHPRRGKPRHRARTPSQPERL